MKMAAGRSRFCAKPCCSSSAQTFTFVFIAFHFIWDGIPFPHRISLVARCSNQSGSFIINKILLTRWRFRRFQFYSCLACVFVPWPPFSSSVLSEMCLWLTGSADVFHSILSSVPWRMVWRWRGAVAAFRRCTACKGAKCTLYGLSVNRLFNHAHERNEWFGFFAPAHSFFRHRRHFVRNFGAIGNDDDRKCKAEVTIYTYSNETH